MNYQERRKAAQESGVPIIVMEWDESKGYLHPHRDVPGWHSNPANYPHIEDYGAIGEESTRLIYYQGGNMGVPWMPDGATDEDGNS